MSYKSTAIESLLSTDPSGRLRSLHDQLITLGLKTKMGRNSDTLLFEAITPTKERVGLLAMRGGNTEVLSFPRAYWVRHTAELDSALENIEPRHIVPPEGFISQSQYSLRQVRVSLHTFTYLQTLVSSMVQSHSHSLQCDA